MEIKRFIGGLLESNGYIIYEADGSKCFVIDPGYNYKAFTDFILKHDLKLIGILLTHHHYDHVGAVEKIRNNIPCKVYMHREDCDMYGKHVDIYMEDGDVIELGKTRIKVILTPGHTKGSVCLLAEKDKVCFTGDTIFNVDLGRTDLEDGSQQDMENSIRNIIAKWQNDIVIYPGHGDECSMKKVRSINREFMDIAEER